MRQVVYHSDQEGKGLVKLASSCIEQSSPTYHHFASSGSDDRDQLADDPAPHLAKIPLASELLATSS
ncbi:hypothetical protein PGTUg99_029821 [Puccinia graminis f. sp. tritici]|uniref:Uncharacterized protein n=1 Tax=Puccinia graminis f. sp. tritici TaxID=56615 RepID=A0A5B0QR45_PUCGR|nr:hypothetical protein PGTUg99_029821 [Puccinia graminis f. sp. tritici]